MESRIELMPGVFLRAIQTDRFKTGCMSLNFVRPMSAGEAPYAALLPSVLLRGTQEHPDIRSISSFLDAHYGASIGSQVRKKGAVQTTGFYADFLDEDLLPSGEKVFEPVMDFIGEMLFRPRMADGRFLPDVVEGEKRNILDAIDWRINDKRSYAVTQLITTMFAGEPGGIPRIGNRPEAEAMTQEGLVDYYHRVLANSRMELFYMGRRSPEYVAGVLRRILAPLPRAQMDAVCLDIQMKTVPVRTVEEVLDVTQGKLCMGFRCDIREDDPLYPAMLMLNTVFGGGPTSKLFMNVREKLSLCYYASSAYDGFRGSMLVSSGIECGNFAVTRDEILRQFRACAEGDISDAEMDNARRMLISSCKAAMDSPGRMEDALFCNALLDGGYSMEALMERIAEVRVSDLQQAASHLHLDTIYFLKGASA